MTANIMAESLAAEVRRLQEREQELLECNTRLLMENRALRGAGEVRFALAAGATMPTRTYDSDSGWDLYAPESVNIGPGRTRVIKTGVSIELPPLHEGQIRPRSGLSSAGIWAAVGTIDNSYRGELGVVLLNTTADTYVVKAGDRVSQLVIAPLARVAMVQSAALSATARGEAGFGSSGR